MLAASGIAHQRLREVTAGPHEALGGHEVPVSMGRQGYSRYLRTVRPLIAIEKALACAGVHRVFPDWDARRRSMALEYDMLRLDIPAWLGPPVIIGSSIGTILGWTYVLEGSRHGARIVLRALLAAGDSDVLLATRFPRHGEGTDFWSSYQNALHRIDDSPTGIEDACTGATAAFALFLGASEPAG